MPQTRLEPRVRDAWCRRLQHKNCSFKGLRAYLHRVDVVVGWGGVQIQTRPRTSHFGNEISHLVGRQVTPISRLYTLSDFDVDLFCFRQVPSIFTHKVNPRHLEPRTLLDSQHAWAWSTCVRNAAQRIRIRVLQRRFSHPTAAGHLDDRSCGQASFGVVIIHKLAALARI